MKKLLLVGALLIASLLSSFGQGLGFNYQAMIRNADGEAITNQNVVMRIGIVQGSITGTVEYTETHDIESNAYGLVNLIVGTGTVVNGVFGEIDWANGPFFIKVELDAESNGNFVTLGTTQLLSVPFANYAFSGGSGSTSWADSEESVSTNKKVGIGTDNPSSYLEIVADDQIKQGNPIFEVKNVLGETVFAVYENEVVVYVDDTTTAASGFAVKSRDNLGNSADLFTVSPQQTRIYVDESAGKETRGGFAITGRTPTKSIIGDLLRVTPTLTEFIVDEPTTKETRGGFAITGRVGKGAEEDIFTVKPSLTELFVSEPLKETRGGFAITGRTPTKGTTEVMNITPGLTQLFIDESNPTKETRGGFAITGRAPTKESGMYDIFTVQPERTEIYVKNNPLKSGIPGFSIFGMDDQFNSGELFSVTEQGAVVNGSMAVAPDVQTGIIEGVTQSEAMVAGAVTDDSGSPIISLGVIYNKSGLLNTGINIDNPLVAGIEYVDPSFASGFTASLYGLAPGTTYQVRAFAVNEDGATGYGEIKTFATNAGFDVTFSVLTWDETPISDATISILDMYGEPMITNAPGDYNFSLAMGSYEVEVIANGYYYKGEISVSTQGELIDIYVDEARKLTLNIQDNLGSAVTDAYVYLELVGGDDMRDIYSNSEGVAIGYLPAGEWAYWISSYQGHEEYIDTLIMPADTDLTVDVTMTSLPKYDVTVHVVDMDSIGLGGASVLLQLMYKNKESYPYAETQTTDIEGNTTFTNVPPNYGYDITATYTQAENYLYGLEVLSDTTFVIQIDTGLPKK